MAEQVFKSPGFFENEVDLSQRQTEIVGVPGGVIGTAMEGPAFVPVTVGSFTDFIRRFGGLKSDKFGPYAVREFLRNRTALTYVRVLGAGANQTTSDFTTTEARGTVRSAGFKIVPQSIATGGTKDGEGKETGAVQFIVARHHVSAAYESVGFPIFTDNDSTKMDNLGFEGDSSFDDILNKGVNLVRGMVMLATGTRMQIMSHNQRYSTITGRNGADEHSAFCANDFADIGPETLSENGLKSRFKIVLSSSAGSANGGFGNSEGYPGIRILTASLNPADDAYIGNILNTSPDRFQEEEHLLYAHFPVEYEIAKVSVHTGSVAITSGSRASNNKTGLTYNKLFGRYDKRYDSSRTTKFISQPYGSKEHSLFHFETIGDGGQTINKYKISIAAVKRSTDSTNPYGTFTVLVRDHYDTDASPQVLEQYPLCTLNPNSDDYIARKIGDFKLSYDFDQLKVADRRMIVEGRYPNVSTRVRVVMDAALENGSVPADALPFGFRGCPVLKTHDALTDTTASLFGRLGQVGGKGGGMGMTDTAYGERQTFGFGGHVGYYSSSLDPAISTSPLTGNLGNMVSELSHSILPPVPYRYKLTTGKMNTSFGTAAGMEEKVDNRLYWGCKFDRIPISSSYTNPGKTDATLDPNLGPHNYIFDNYSKMLGIIKMDQVVTGVGADAFNNNKFTLARVSLPHRVTSDIVGSVVSGITGTVKDNMLESVYVRNGRPALGTYGISYGGFDRVTFATLSSLTSSAYFNKFIDYMKFTNFMFGGWDGTNILDPDMAKMNDKAMSSDTGGKGVPSVNLDIGIDVSSADGNNFGIDQFNPTVAAYRAAADIMTDRTMTRVNVLAVPGVRQPIATDHISGKVKANSRIFYAQDIPNYDKDKERLFDDSVSRPDVVKTADVFDARKIDNNYTAAYFPDVTLIDDLNDTQVRVPASVSVLGAIGYNDKVGFPWFAPAGFNRAALELVVNTKSRLNAADRDYLYERRVNPIASFPSAGYVIFGQKTLQIKKSALDRVNVRRMLLEVKRRIVEIANGLLFEPNTPATRAQFVSQVIPKLALIQSQQGIDQFKVVCDSSNNTQRDVELNKLNGRIVLVPTRAVEFIVMDFIITNSGVEFE